MTITAIHDRIIGDDDGTPVLLIHGFTVDHRILLPLDDVFARSSHSWRRHYIDLPGFGASPAGPEVDGADALGRAVEDYIGERFGTEPFAVVGNSLGGALARRIACSMPDRILGMCLIVPSVVPLAERDRPAPSRFDEDTSLLEELSGEDRAAYAEMAVDLTRDNWERYRDAVLPGLRTYDRTVAARIWADFSFAAEPETLLSEPLSAPSLLVTARQDSVVGFVDQLRLLEHYDRMSMLLIDRAGHNVHIDRPAPVRAAVGDWIDRMAPERGSAPRL
ncbi:alpha/beta fold hydrolase [Tsukamurella pseudospumae]|uniref:AB hydrolase-1 domain-containing protein n=1 Tax=Tsukamurella pseudospumae TaxID=239498 RepID=A0A138A149_9ACTN|nr:alpha/beta hydrolase [Tsukamurella pseudospumae]KXO99630.1 hypothetical protein AXK61_16790 [Tsukamurella pseudospumae]KXP04150.1 hypothetical protein AXK60_15475 [Tsukamurella pseudospumae]